MHVVKELLDDAFENYVLATEAKATSELRLEIGALPPLGVPPAATKEQWHARIFHNGLTQDPFRAGSAYLVNGRGDVLHATTDRDGHLATRKVIGLPHLAEAHPDMQFENVSMAVLAPNAVLLSDGTGDLFVLSGDASSPWSIRFSGAPFGKPTSLTLLEARLEDEIAVHGVVSQLLFPTSADASGSTYAISAFSINLQSGSVATTLLYTGGKPLGYASFASATDLLLLVEGPHELKVALQQPPPTPIVHKRPHDVDDDDADGPELLKCLRAGIGFDGVHQSPHVPASSLGHATDALYDRFVASSTPFSSMETATRSAPASSAPVPDESARIEIATPDSILGGFEECDDLDPNATAVLYRYDVASRACLGRLHIDCRRFHFLGASATPLQTSVTTYVPKKLLFQYDVHGVVFGVGADLRHLELLHEATFQALAYVQASKEQKKYLQFHPSSSLAAIAEFEKRLFVYTGPQESGAGPHRRSHYLEELALKAPTIYGLQFLDAQSLLLLTPSALLRVSIPTLSS
ncbi:hypothetical protein SPRG_09794 [Saprolegnia parasitica CBS 223.65]|uniref:Uncharacterized protein n=1 Tax=Saprolegnia parasitica (strain CBS 223.65) TaxID=695850 RepID=A0A067C5I1_SAPPC|nr:hypothetical protein SPRG_09794 [Saprolegnia parasitica CBS 223.65]KDO24405.1 hypothetical protein SPRG_09794 [Saprolegnia parasitica CBS 223.65]|eukprot:XP_012204835.1 hypothetical protein SPRG_09794 [Saprolegnia parasitica CBS 223.65]